MVAVFFWVAFSVGVGMLAGKRGRGSGNWFVISVVVSPLLALIFLFASDDLSKKKDLLEPEPVRIPCPACAEPVLPEATKCKHCGTELTPDLEFNKRRIQEHSAKLAEAQKTKNQANLIVAGIIAIVAIGFMIAIAR